MYFFQSSSVTIIISWNILKPVLIYLCLVIGWIVFVYSCSKKSVIFLIQWRYDSQYIRCHLADVLKHICEITIVLFSDINDTIYLWTEIDMILKCGTIPHIKRVQSYSGFLVGSNGLNKSMSTLMNVWYKDDILLKLQPC